MRIKRKQAYAIRSSLHEMELSLKSDRSGEAEKKRDLIATACLALWELDIKRLMSCLQRLQAPNVLDLALQTFRP